MEIFSDGIHCLKICSLNIVPVQRFFKLKFCYLAGGQWLFFLDHGNNVPGACIGGLSSTSTALLHALPIYLCTHDSHAHNYAVLLVEAYSDSACCSYPVQSFSKSGQTHTVLPQVYWKIFSLKIVLDSYIHPKLFHTKYFHVEIE